MSWLDEGASLILNVLKQLALLIVVRAKLTAVRKIRTNLADRKSDEPHEHITHRPV